MPPQLFRGLEHKNGDPATAKRLPIKFAGGGGGGGWAEGMAMSRD